MMETIIVLFVLFVLIAFGFIFYANYQRSSLLEQQERITQSGAVDIVQSVSSLPELQCTEGEVVKGNCIDRYKITALTTIAGENAIFYYDIFGFSNITIQKIYPPALTPPYPPGTDCIKKTEGCTVYNRAPSSYRDVLATNVPITIKNPLNNHKEFGIITIQTYQ